MKTRSSFVANSSSSSFILSTDKYDKDINATITLKVPINRYINQIIKNKEDLDEYFKDCYCYEDIEELSGYDKKYYDNLKSILDKGRIILLGSVSNEDDEFGSILYYNSLKDANFDNTDIVLEQDIEG